MTRRPIVWLHSGEREPETDLWDPATAEWVERPSGSKAAGIAYGLISLVAGILLGILFAQHVLAAPRTSPDTAQATSGAPQNVSADGSGDVTRPVQKRPEAPAATSGVTSPATESGAPLDSPYSRGRTGVIAYATIGGPNYLAIPLGPGVRVRICAATCLVLVSTDAGPNSERIRAGRIADVALGHWRVICGLTAARGICAGSWTVVGPGSTPPATDTR